MNIIERIKETAKEIADLGTLEHTLEVECREKILSNKALKLAVELSTKTERLLEAAKECTKYLNVSDMETIGSGSYLHKQLMAALKEFEDEVTG